MKRLLIFLLLLASSSHVFAGKQGTVAYGAKISNPQLVSLSATVYPYHAWLVQFEPGVAGGKINIGLGGNYQYTIGIAFKASVLRTWGSEIGGAETNETYIGSEFEFMWKGVNLTLGKYSNASDIKERDSFYSVGLGIGF